jgi:hypothetical protein
MKYGQVLEQESVPEWSLRMSSFAFAMFLSRKFQSTAPQRQSHANALTQGAARHTDNVDYNSLKHEIKVHTTRRQATAMAIPGHQDASLRKFEGGLYQELCGQHDRVDLFVNSKADEISRRLSAYPVAVAGCSAFALGTNRTAPPTWILC